MIRKMLDKLPTKEIHWRIQRDGRLRNLTSIQCKDHGSIRTEYMASRVCAMMETFPFGERQHRATDNHRWERFPHWRRRPPDQPRRRADDDDDGIESLLKFTHNRLCRFSFNRTLSCESSRVSPRAWLSSERELKIASIVNEWVNSSTAAKLFFVDFFLAAVWWKIVHKKKKFRWRKILSLNCRIPAGTNCCIWSLHKVVS